MRLPNEPDLPPRINIVPMVDVIFAILTFFVMSSLFLTRSEGLPVNLPSAVTGEQTDQQQERWVVTIDAQENLFLNREPIQLSDLTRQVRSQLQAGNAPTVVINADETVPHGSVIAVMDELRRIPGVRLAIATQSPEN
jgi:biopolymer transport protein ExbD